MREVLTANCDTPGVLLNFVIEEVTPAYPGE